MKRNTPIIIFAVAILLLGGQLSSPIQRTSLQSELAQLVQRGLTYRFLDNNMVEIADPLSGDKQFKSLEEPREADHRSWAATRGVPILEINPSQIDTNQYAGWYNYWTEVPMANSLGIPLVVDDLDQDGRPDVYGTFKNFTSTDFEAHVHEVSANGIVEFGFNYVPRPGVSRLIADVDQDSLREIMFSFGGGVYNYEQSTRDSLPTRFRFRYERHQGGIDPGYTGIHVGYLDKDSLSDLLYKGSEPDSTNPNHGISKIYIAEYNSDSTNFVRSWSKTYVSGSQSGIGGFAVDDFDKDGKMEFVVSDLTSGQVFVTENVADNAFVQTWRDSTPFVNLYYLTSGDVDGDGRPEFFVGATMSNGNWTLVYEADSNDNFSLQFLLHLTAGGVLDSPVYLTKDIDGDGRPELVIFSGAYLHVFKARTDNDYQLFFLKRETNRRSVQVYDFDGNGKFDFLISKDELDSLGRSRLRGDIYLASTVVSVLNSATHFKGIPLEPNYPNPFNGSTSIQFSLQNTQWVTIGIYDILGREVSVLVNEMLAGGDHQTRWDASNMASGIYFCRMKTLSGTLTRKMILQR